MTQAVAVDGHGNVFVAGEYDLEEDNGTYDLDPGDGLSPVRMNFGKNFFLTKFDCFGNFLWSRVWDVSNGKGGIVDIACDNDGNSYIAAVFGGTVDIDPGPEEQILCRPECDVLGIMRFDPVGNLQWYVSAGDSKNIWTEFHHGKIEVDDSGNVFLFGGFEGEADFDPGPIEDIRVSINQPWEPYTGGIGVTTCHNGCSEYTVYDPSAYLSCFDTQGRFRWCRTWETYSDYLAGGLACDRAGGVYVTGFFRGIRDLDPGEGVEIRGDENRNNGYVSRFDSAGILAWVRTWEGDHTFDCRDIASIGSGDALLVGFFGDEINLDPTPGNEDNPAWWIEAGNYSNMGLLRFSRDGAFRGATIWEGVRSNYDLDICTSPNGASWILGSFYNDIDFDPGSGTDLHEMFEHEGMFLCNLAPSGQYRWSRVWTSSRVYYVRDLAVSPDGYAWVAQGMMGDVVWGSVTEKRNWTYGDYDCSLIRFSPEGD